MIVISSPCSNYYTTVCAGMYYASELVGIEGLEGDCIFCPGNFKPNQTHFIYFYVRNKVWTPSSWFNIDKNKSIIINVNSLSGAR